MFSRTTIALIVLGALASAMAAVVVREEPAAVGVPRAEHGTSSRSGARESATDLAVALKLERFASEMTGNPFAGREMPRPTVAVTAPPPGPPPFAYRYGGQIRTDTGGWRVYLLKGNDLVPINVGDVLDGSYKITVIGADQFEVVHLPSSTTHVLLYSSLGKGATLAHGEQAPLAPASDESVASTPSATGSAALMGVPSISDAYASPRATPSHGAVTGGGAVPSGSLGTSAPVAGTPRLGAAPPASGSMPMSPAPAGTMQTLPAPTGRLGV